MKIKDVIDRLKQYNQDLDIEVLIDDDSIRQIDDIDVLTYVGTDKKSAIITLKAVSKTCSQCNSLRKYETGMCKCIGVKHPFTIEDIQVPCVAYPEVAK